MTTIARAAAVVSAVLLALTLGCANLSKVVARSGSSNKASAKSTKDVAACKKMCAVAGDAEDNKAAVEKCQKKCTQ
jgi:hypothetical protein